MRASLAIALSAGLALIPREASSQVTGAVAGLVTDSQGQAVSGVLVFVDDGAIAVLTDTLGLFGFTGLSVERHVLNYRKSGYSPRSFALDLSGGADFRDLGRVVLAPGPEPTASLTGRVTDGEAGPGLVGATIEVNGVVVAVTDDSGAFAAPESPVRWGPNELTVRHRSFSDRIVNDRIWVANSGETFELAVSLGIVPIALPEVGVEIPSRVLAQNGFYERRDEISTAEFLTRDEIVARHPRRMGDLLRGVLTAGPDFNRAATTFGRADDGRPCIPLFFIDGLLVRDVSTRDLDQMLHPEDVEGIELYRSVAGLPARFSPIGAVCGVVIIWTR